MRRRLIIAFYHLSKALGLFHIARHLTRDGLRVLCYHGFSLDDEEAFRAGLFVRPADFLRRMDFLARHGFPVLSLSSAIARLEAGGLPSGATVITIDDGFYSVYRHGFETLKRHGFPATLYVTSYYVQKESPIFQLCVSYMLWKGAGGTADLSAIGVPDLRDATEVPLATAAERDRIEDCIVDYGKDHCDESGRCEIARRLGEALGVDYAEIAGSRILSLVNAAELREMVDSVIDVALHTHRHRFPTDPAEARRELEDNRAALGGYLKGPPDHFCYPSGDWSRSHWQTLNDCAVETATTCDMGLVYRDTPRFALNRILDSHRVSQIEFEAEMYGFSELIRRVRRRIGSGSSASSGQSGSGATAQ